MSEMYLNFDGLCEPTNPGTGAWGFFLRVPDAGTSGNCGVIPGTVTNNVAEYYAAGHGLRFVLDYSGPLALRGRPLVVRGDSLLVVNQVNGVWECRKGDLIPLRDRVRQLVERLAAVGTAVTFCWVRREENEEADALSRQAWERHMKRKVPVRPAKR